MTRMVADAGNSRFQTAADQLPRTSGIVLHSPVLYDFTVWLAFLGDGYPLDSPDPYRLWFALGLLS